MPPPDPQDEPINPDSTDEQDDFDPSEEEEEEEEELEAQPETPQIPTSYRLAQLEHQYQTLETLFALTVSGLIILSLGLNWYLFKQTRIDRSVVHQQKLFVGRMQKEFEKRATVIREFITSLESYTKTDPEFQRILDKYQDALGKYYTTTGDKPSADQ